MSVTIKDIAKEAGVSYSTVSRALNNLDLVNPETKKLVLATAQKMGYMPNPSAVNLKTRRTNMLGVYFSTISEMSSPVVLHNILTAVYEVIDQNYNVVVKGIDKHIPGSLNPAFYDGIIHICQRDEDKVFMKEAMDKHIPLVVVNRKPPYQLNAVLTDERDAMYRAMKYLLDHGHRRIVALEGPEDLYSSKQRHRGWMDAIEEYGIDPQRIPVFHGTYRFESGLNLAEKILSLEPTALLSFNDEMAFGVERYMIQQGLQVPQDLSIIGFDNWNKTMYTSMDLTTVERNMHDLAEEATRLLLKEIQDKENDLEPAHSKTVFLEAPLIERGSVETL